VWRRKAGHAWTDRRRAAQHQALFPRHKAEQLRRKVPTRAASTSALADFDAVPSPVAAAPARKDSAATVPNMTLIDVPPVDESPFFTDSPVTPASPSAVPGFPDFASRFSPLPEEVGRAPQPKSPAPASPRSTQEMRNVEAGRASAARQLAQSPPKPAPRRRGASENGLAMLGELSLQESSPARPAMHTRQRSIGDIVGAVMATAKAGSGGAASMPGPSQVSGSVEVDGRRRTPTSHFRALSDTEPVRAPPPLPPKAAPALQPSAVKFESGTKQRQEKSWQAFEPEGSSEGHSDLGHVQSEAAPVFAPPERSDAWSSAPAPAPEPYSPGRRVPPPPPPVPRRRSTNPFLPDLHVETAFARPSGPVSSADAYALPAQPRSPTAPRSPGNPFR
jgi:hypothetical protein